MKEELFLFNDALNTFYFRLFGVGHVLKESRCRSWATLSD